MLRLNYLDLVQGPYPFFMIKRNGVKATVIWMVALMIVVSSFDLSLIDIPEEYEKNSGAVSKGTKPDLDGRQLWDYASYDMHIDNALALNESITTFDDVYYFAYPCSSSIVNEQGGCSESGYNREHVP